MLKYVSKQGKTVLEEKDNGEFSFVSEELKKKGLTESKDEKKEDEE